MITVTDLYKSFPMGGQTLTVLKGVNLQIRRGELIAIVGARAEEHAAPYYRDA
jgi:ABC-type lipoprotein export system ATPase subunit